MVSTGMALSDLPSLDKGEDPTKYKREPQNSFQKLMRLGSKTVLNNEITKHSEQTIDVISRIGDGGNIRDLLRSFIKSEITTPHLKE